MADFRAFFAEAPLSGGFSLLSVGSFHQLLEEGVA
jgi:hypothetical protein